MRNYETRLDIPNCCGVIERKHDHIRNLEKVLVNFTTVRRHAVWCQLATVNKGQISVLWFCKERKIEWHSGVLKCSYRRTHMAVIMIGIETVVTEEHTCSYFEGSCILIIQQSIILYSCHFYNPYTQNYKLFCKHTHTHSMYVSFYWKIKFLYTSWLRRS